MCIEEKNYSLQILQEIFKSPFVWNDQDSSFTLSALYLEVLAVLSQNNSSGLMTELFLNHKLRWLENNISLGEMDFEWMNIF